MPRYPDAFCLPSLLTRPFRRCRSSLARSLARSGQSNMEFSLNAVINASVSAAHQSSAAISLVNSCISLDKCSNWTNSRTRVRLKSTPTPTCISSADSFSRSAYVPFRRTSDPAPLTTVHCSRYLFCRRHCRLRLQTRSTTRTFGLQPWQQPQRPRRNAMRRLSQTTQTRLARYVTETALGCGVNPPALYDTASTGNQLLVHSNIHPRTTILLSLNVLY